MTRLSFSVPGKPQPKQRPRLGKGGSVYTPSATTAYEHSVKTYALQAMSKCGWGIGLPGRYAVWLHIHWPDERRRDVDNVAKVVLDGMNRMVFDDDSSVFELHVYSCIAAGNPRVIVDVERVGS